MLSTVDHKLLRTCAWKTACQAVSGGRLPSLPIRARTLHGQAGSLFAETGKLSVFR
jgi:hypothetical protein